MEEEMKQQLYLIEILIDKISVFVSENEGGQTRRLTIKMMFGPKALFIVREGDLHKSDQVPEDNVERDEDGHRKWSRTIRIGKSYLFPSYPDGVMQILSKFPLDIEVWDDYAKFKPLEVKEDEKEKVEEKEKEEDKGEKKEKEKKKPVMRDIETKDDPIYIGMGTMRWESIFYRWMEATIDASKLQTPITVKQKIPLYAECCCAQCGDVTFILRLSALGESVITEFDQLPADKNRWIFRNSKSPTVVQCKKFRGEDNNFLPVGIVYETLTLEDPDTLAIAKTKYEICTELLPCADEIVPDRCQNIHEFKPEKIYKIDKIRMGDITGPCGNTNCALARKVRAYIRSLEAYKKAHKGKKSKEDHKKRPPCGKCICEKDSWHRKLCKDHTAKEGESKAKEGKGKGKKAKGKGDDKAKADAKGKPDAKGKAKEKDDAKGKADSKGKTKVMIKEGAKVEDDAKGKDGAKDKEDQSE